MKKVLITGVNGFIGQHVISELSRVHEVLGVGSQACASNQYAYVSSDFSRASLHELFVHFTPDVVVHCAGRASVQQALEQPDVDFDAGPSLIFNIYNALRQAKSHAFVIQMSSAAVYGNPIHLPITEECPLAPISSYGWHKRMCECLGHEFSTIYGVHGFALRIFSCYGNGQRKLLLWDAANKILSGNFAFHGTGKETRDYIHVEDLARLVALLIECNTPKMFTVLNVASGEQQSVAAIIGKLQKAMQAKQEPLIFNNELSCGVPRFWQANVSRIRELGFSPQVSLEDGIELYANWFSSLRKM